MLKLDEKVDLSENSNDDVKHLLHPKVITLSYYLCGTSRDSSNPPRIVEDGANICPDCLFKWESINAIL